VVGLPVDAFLVPSTGGSLLDRLGRVGRGEEYPPWRNRKEHPPAEGMIRTRSE